MAKKTESRKGEGTSADIARTVPRDATGELVRDISRGENPGGYR